MNITYYDRTLEAIQNEMSAPVLIVKNMFDKEDGYGHNYIITEQKGGIIIHDFVLGGENEDEPILREIYSSVMPFLVAVSHYGKLVAYEHPHASLELRNL
jgi:hypothetical protein